MFSPCERRPGMLLRTVAKGTDRTLWKSPLTGTTDTRCPTPAQGTSPTCMSCVAPGFFVTLECVKKKGKACSSSPGFRSQLSYSRRNSGSSSVARSNHLIQRQNTHGWSGNIRTAQRNRPGGPERGEEHWCEMPSASPCL